MTTNHPAHGPVSLDRLHQIREILSKASAQSDGGNLGYAMADAVKLIDGVIAIPETIPCPVHLEPGLKFGKGVRTECVLNALRRRAEYYAELEAMTPEQRAEHDAAIAEFKAMLHAGNSPATPDGWIPVSERMPEGMKTVITSNGFDIGQGWWDGEGWKSFDCHDVVPGKVTHWMPLPAAPQQEVK